MKKIIFIVLVFNSIFGYCQSKWYSQIELDTNIPNRMEYNYSFMNRGTEIDLESKIGIALQYSINRYMSKRFSLGGVLRIHSQYGPKFFSFGTGLKVKYFFVNHENIHLLFRYLPNFSFNSKKFQFGNNLRIGLATYFGSKKNLILGVFKEMNHYNLNGSEPLVFGNETPSTLYVYSYGISFGIKF